MTISLSPASVSVSTQPLAPARADLDAARGLARGYLRYVSSVWRGDPAGQPFAAALDRYWVARLPPAPAPCPAAISPHGGAGHGIGWFAVAGEVLGYIAGAEGGYRVPLVAVPELLASMPRGESASA